MKEHYSVSEKATHRMEENTISEIIHRYPLLFESFHQAT